MKRSFQWWFVIYALVGSLIAITARQITGTWGEQVFGDPAWIDINLATLLARNGVIYALVGQTIWCVSQQPSPGLRFLVIAGATFVGACVLSVQQPFETPYEDVLNEFVHLGGIVLIQSFLFGFFGLGRDATSRRDELDESDASPPIRQFTIADVMLVTVWVATLLSLAMKQSTVVEPAEYWLGMGFVWWGLPAVAAALLVATFHPERATKCFFMVAAVALSIATCWVLVMMEDSLGRFDPFTKIWLLLHYGCFFCVYFLTWLLFAHLARRMHQGLKRFPVA